ncbi:MAG TPA: FGGY-family carbohydrate kinase, partial [Capillimicrobium sp.]|nr:FGGY-family carbohydrate kinase [Capillimicrobium sp.]
TGQMAGVLGIDEAGDPVTPYDSWLDSRCAPQLRRIAADHGDLLVTRTGCPPMLDHAPKMQWWRDERPAEYARIRAFVMPGVHVAMRLAGLRGDQAFIDPSYLHFTGVADGLTGTWSPDLLAALELDGDRMPAIVPSDAIVGEVTAEAAARTGLAPGTPVAAGLGDTAAGVLGAGIVRPGQLLDTAGTAAVLIGSVDAFCPDPRQGLMVMRGVFERQYLPLNYVAGGGLCMPWLLDLTERAPGAERAAALRRLFAEAEAAPLGADGLVFLPHVEGRMAPHDPEMRGGWLGMSLAHSRGHLARSMLEAIAFEYATYLTAMRRCHPGVAFDEARAIGGGARSMLWNRIKADVLGVRVERVAAEETATRGAALIAAAGAGLLEDLAAVAGDAPTVDPVEPDADRHARYAPLAERYAAVVELVSAHGDLLNLHPKPERHLVA